MPGFLFLGTAVVVGWGVYGLLSPRPRFVFGARPLPKGRELVRAVMQAAAHQMAAPVRRATDAMGWPMQRVLLIVMVLTVLGTLFAAAVAWWLALALVIPLIYLSWRFAGHVVLSQYKLWQRRMVTGLPAMLAVLRVHLDLGRTVPDALAAVLPGVQDPLRQELSRTLSDMAMAASRQAQGARNREARQALQRLADRVDRLEFRTVADTLTQTWDAKLSGAALEPLQDLLRITREQEAEELTGRLDVTMTTAPGLAVFAIAIWAMAGWLLHSLGHGGVF